MRWINKKVSVLLAIAMLVSGCSNTTLEKTYTQEPSVAESDTTHDDLLSLPKPKEKVIVALYSYLDKTGKYQPSENFQSLSRAVTQGADAVIIKALHDAGDGKWFTVVERSGLGNLLKERQILRESFAIYQENTDPKAVPPLTIAGVLLEGGVISFDSNQVTGGIGARYLGIGANTEYRRDVVAVYLRATSVINGEVLANVNVTKTIFSVGLRGDVFRFVTDNRILEFEAGASYNEPEHFALKQAIEKAVISLVFEGAKKGIWGFDKDIPELRQRFERYLEEKKQRPLIGAKKKPKPVKTGFVQEEYFIPATA